MDIEDLIDDYNNGNESEWMKYFGDELDVFFKYAHRRGFFDKLDILDEHQNEYLNIIGRLTNHKQSINFLLRSAKSI